MHLEMFLNALLAQIKMGLSFRSAFKKAISVLNHKHFEQYFTEILQMICFSKALDSKGPFFELKHIIEELKRADRSTQCLEHLENLRHQTRIRSLFRKKATVALFQVHIQSLVLLILYCGLFVFVLHQYGLRYMKILFLSIFLFFLGLAVLFKLGKRIKWTV